MSEKDRAEKLNNGADQRVCIKCSDKYRTRKEYKGAIKLFNDDCFICHKHTMVGPSRLLFGLSIPK